MPVPDLATRARGGHSARVPQQPIELILLRHLASRLAIPVFIVDAKGDMIYFNEAAESVLGRRYDEIRTMPFEEWSTAFLPRAETSPLAAEDLPLAVAVRERKPDHRDFEITDSEGNSRRIGASAFPIEGSDGTLAGAVAMFWEVGAS